MSQIAWTESKYLCILQAHLGEPQLRFDLLERCLSDGEGELLVLGCELEQKVAFLDQLARLEVDLAQEAIEARSHLRFTGSGHCPLIFEDLGRGLLLRQNWLEHQPSDGECRDTPTDRSVGDGPDHGHYGLPLEVPGSMLLVTRPRFASRSHGRRKRSVWAFAFGS